MDKTDKMMDGFLLCDYLEDNNEDYSGIYVSSEDEADEELYYERQLEEVKYQEQYENRCKNNPICNVCYKEEEEEKLNEKELNQQDNELNEEDNELNEQVDNEFNEQVDNESKEDTDEEDNEIEIQLEELKALIIQIENKIDIIESNNSNMITTNFFINKKKYNDNLQEISILKNKKKDYEKSIEFIYRLQISIKYFQGH